MNIKKGKRDVLRKVIKEARPNLIVEIGTSRHLDSGDGQATFLFDTLDSTVVSIDKDLLAVSTARAELDHVIVIWGDGKVCLANMHGQIDLLYLDGSNDPEEAWRQFEVAPLGPESVVVIDDAMDYNGNAYGKATKIIQNTQEWAIELTPFIGRYKMAILRRRKR